MNVKETQETSGYRKGAITYEHPSMVTVGFSRIQGKVQLFGSSIEHHNYISLHINEAQVTRDLSTDWVHSKKPIIEVLLSPTQFAELLTSMNVGDGVCGTLHYLNGQYYENPIMPTKAEQFNNEIKKDLDNSFSTLMDAEKELKELLNDNKPIGKKRKESLLSKVNAFSKLVKDHLPFIIDQFGEQMEKTVVEAKGEVDAFVQHTIVTTGIEAIKKNHPLIGDSNVKD